MLTCVHYAFFIVKAVFFILKSCVFLANIGKFYILNVTRSLYSLENRRKTKNFKPVFDCGGIFFSIHRKIM